MEKSRYMPYGTRFERERMISEGGPVAFDPTQVDFREPLPPYEYKFSSSEVLKNFASFFEAIPFDEVSLEVLLHQHLQERKVSPQSDYLRSMLGELFLESAIRRAVEEISGVQKFPNVYVSENYEVRARGIGHNVFQYYTNELGKKRRKNIKQFDGLIHVKGDKGDLLPVVLESKVCSSNLGRNALNSALRPSGAYFYTKNMREMFGDIGFGVAAPVDSLSDENPLQRHFKENGGVLLPFPFTYQQADQIAQRVAASQSRHD